MANPPISGLISDALGSRISGMHEPRKKDYYAVLGVPRAETLPRIKSAYRTLAKQTHPDHAGIRSRERFEAIQEAYEVLSDPDKREAYDASLDRRRPSRRAMAVEPEPLVPTRPRSPVSWPEPLVPERAEVLGGRPSPMTFADDLADDVERLFEALVWGLRPGRY
jgi:hypothetical protein